MVLLINCVFVLLSSTFIGYVGKYGKDDRDNDEELIISVLSLNVLFLESEP